MNLISLTSDVLSKDQMKKVEEHSLKNLKYTLIGKVLESKLV